MTIIHCTDISRSLYLYITPYAFFSNFAPKQLFNMKFMLHWCGSQSQHNKLHNNVIKQWKSVNHRGGKKHICNDAV